MKNIFKPSDYLVLEPRTLREVCQTRYGEDDIGQRCPPCDLRAICERQQRSVQNP